MALISIDGFDHYATADISKKWTIVGSSAAISPAAGRKGSGALTLNLGLSSGFVTKTIAPGASFIVGFSFNPPSIAACTIAAFLDAGTTQCELRLNVDGTLSVTRNGTAVTGGTSTFALSANTTVYLEWKVTIADAIAAGSCVVRANGVPVITVATGQDLKNTANASANQFRLGTAGGGGPAASNFDDFYLCDLTGTTNNDFLGDVHVDTILPNADGAHSQFTPSTGTSHFALVDEATPNTTDYNDGLNVGDRDSYALANLPALVSQTVYAVQVNAAVMKDDIGAKSAATMIRSGTTNADGTSVPLGTGQAYISQIFATNPSGGVAWTEASVNALEAGVVVTA